MTARGPIQSCREELATLEDKLADFREYAASFNRTTEEEMQIVKQRLVTESTNVLMKLAIKSLKLAEHTEVGHDRRDARRFLREIMQNVMQPLASSRMKALDMLREIHDPNTCVDCEAKNPCHKGRASFIMRDLTNMTICIFQPTPEGGGATNSWRNSCGMPLRKAATATHWTRESSHS